MKIAEIFKSRQGEGALVGTESVFIRASGCNLRCWFCDTPYTSWQPEGEDLSIDGILTKIQDWDCDFVVLTGGEPMLFSELIPLAEELHSLNKHITIETAGTLYLPVVCDLMSISPKLKSSTPSEDRDSSWHRRHAVSRHRPDIVQRLMREYHYQLKFVVDSPEDCIEVQRYLDALPGVDLSHVMLMPQGTDSTVLQNKSEWLIPYCEDNGVQYCPRRHVEWYGLSRAT